MFQLLLNDTGYRVSTATSGEEALAYMELVTPDGTVIEVGGKNGCYESGPFDLPGLICGHEGTFGIVTRLWVRLIPKATSFRTLVAIFSSTADACGVVAEVIYSPQRTMRE